MPVVGRLDQFGSMLVSGEFNETTANNPSITGLGTYYASEFNENILDIVTSGLVMNLDAGNTSSYPGSGITWTDLSGNGNNGTLTNGPTYSSANGGSIVFDGTNDYVNIGVGKGVNQFSGDFAVSVWVMADSTGSTFGNIIGDYYTNSIATTNEWQLMISNTSQISFYRVGTGSIFNIASGYSANTWINVAVTRIGSTISLYTNSNLIATATNSEIFGTATGNFNIGIDGNNTIEPFKGKIATVQIYKNKGLSAAEVSQNFNALASRFGLSSSPSSSLTANVFPPYNTLYDEFAGVLYGPGQGTFMRQEVTGNVVVYNEIDEIGLDPIYVSIIE